eukprot:CAMPEP_0172187190 /NCGR_PEP_ID=MMETSP1050-20130122/21207_1 /TAXON_ID=233186 /ORGANISM="Cryptomonas curvata, Strain CCAP979/52" /LENGTH=102 /DNA_ID=CAMNT_0012861499 /DNA_START=225 /DNA_END=530 /DNA_ORIENTATION=+
MNIQSQSSAVYIDVLNDPGLPNGAQISATVVTTVQANFLNASASPVETWRVTYRTFSFTPQRRQEGLRYQVCFRARDDNGALTRCTLVVVAAPAPGFVEALS